MYRVNELETEILKMAEKQHLKTPTLKFRVCAQFGIWNRKFRKLVTAVSFNYGEIK